MNLRPRSGPIVLAALGALILAAVAVPVAGGRTAATASGEPDIAIYPASETKFVGETATFNAVVFEIGEPGEPPPPFAVTFNVIEGPNAGLTKTVESDENGIAFFRYTSTTTGTDHVQASFFDLDEGGPIASNVATQAWNPATLGLSVPDRPQALVKPPGATSFSAAAVIQDLPKATIVDIGGNRAMTLQNYFSEKMTFVGVPDRVPSRFELTSGVRSRLGTIILTLRGGNFKACSGARTLSVAGAAAKTKKPVRRLWGFGKGHYRVRGKYASATVRGTFWELADFCNGTLIHVREGSVQVHDFAADKNVVVEGGQSYFAPAPG